MAHETSTGSSPIVAGLMNCLREAPPKDEQLKLAAYADRAGQTEPRGDFHRARHCLSVAASAAEKSSWDQVPWEKLLQEALEIG